MFWGLGIASAFSAIGFLFRPKGNKKTKMVKMLTQDGKLVEVDISKLSGKKTKIKDEQIHTWVRNKTSKL